MSAAATALQRPRQRDLFRSAIGRRQRWLLHFSITLLTVALGACSPLSSSVEQPGVAGQQEATASITTPILAPTYADAVDVRYDKERQLIELHESGGMVSLPMLAAALPQSALRETAPGEWLLGADLHVERGAVLEIAGPAVRWLRLWSDKDRFVSLKTLGGQLRIAGTRITSWDPGLDDYDHNYTNGRSFVLARDGAIMAIVDSELSYLGYDANESYGVAWRLRGTTGEAKNSVFGHNFYGLYLYEASGVLIKENEVHHSVRYGIDPHTSSNKLVIDGNMSHHNGKQGIILAEGCSESIIRNNLVHHNGLHGIVLFNSSNNNLLENNTSYENALHGININNADRNTIQGNTVYGNGEAGIGVGQGARGNLINENTVRENLRDGIYIFSGAIENRIQSNTVIDNSRYGIYIKSNDNIIGAGNEITRNDIGVFLNSDRTPQFEVDSNRIYDNRRTDIRAAEIGK